MKLQYPYNVGRVGTSDMTTLKPNKIFDFFIQTIKVIYTNTNLQHSFSTAQNEEIIHGNVKNHVYFMVVEEPKRHLPCEM